MYNINVNNISGLDSCTSSIYNMFDSNVSFTSPTKPDGNIHMQAITKELSKIIVNNKVTVNAANNDLSKESHETGNGSKDCNDESDESDYENELFSGFDPNKVMGPIEAEQSLTKQVLQCKMNLKKYLHDKSTTDINQVKCKIWPHEKELADCFNVTVPQLTDSKINTIKGKVRGRGRGRGILSCKTDANDADDTLKCAPGPTTQTEELKQFVETESVDDKKSQLKSTTESNVMLMQQFETSSNAVSNATANNKLLEDNITKIMKIKQLRHQKPSRTSRKNSWDESVVSFNSFNSHHSSMTTEQKKSLLIIDSLIQTNENALGVSREDIEFLKSQFLMPR